MKLDPDVQQLVAQLDRLSFKKLKKGPSRFNIPLRRFLRRPQSNGNSADAEPHSLHGSQSSGNREDAASPHVSESSGNAPASDNSTA